MNTSTGILIWAIAAMLVVILMLVVPRLLRAQSEGQSQDAALRNEIDSNLAMLQDYWARLRPRESREDEVHSMQKRLYAREFANTPLPRFSRQAFELVRVSLAQSRNAKKAARVANFYADLDRLEEIQRELMKALAAGDHAPGPSTGAGAEGDSNYSEFLRIAGRAWDDAWHRIERLLAQGNSL